MVLKECVDDKRIPDVFSREGGAKLPAPYARSDSCCHESAMSYAQAQFVAENLESHEQQSTEIRSLVLTSEQASL